MTDIQRLYKNNELRGVSVSTGEITAVEVAGGDTDFVVCTIPAKSVVTKITILSDGVNTDQSVTITIAGVPANLDVTAATPAVSGNVTIATTKDEQVQVTGVDQFTKGRIIVMVDFIRPDVVTGDRVRAA
jgi:hypothetical protein